MATTLDSVKDYCRADNRICPMPQRWNELFNLLRNKKPNEPSVPLILAAWWEVSAMDKQTRFIQHLEWAEKNDQIDEISDFIYGLPETDWFHIGD